MKNVSATKYSIFEQCPRKYQYQYIYELFQQKSEALAIGSLYHRLLENYHKGNTEVVRSILDESGENKTVLEHLFTKYLASPILGEVLETEYKFWMKIPGADTPIFGFIDRVDKDKGVEYKTTSKKWKEEDTDTIQTKIYLYILLKKFGKPVPLVYSINNKKTKLPPQTIIVEKTEEEILRQVKNILGTFRVTEENMRKSKKYEKTLY